MKKSLVTYTTMSGSTAEIAREIARLIGERGMQVDVLPLEDAGDPGAYDAVVVGAPMLLGWHFSARRFLAKHRRALRQVPLAVFATGMSLTWRSEKEIRGVPVFVDEKLAQPFKVPGRPSLKEHHTDIVQYAAPILRHARPVSLAFFGGRLELGRLKVPAVLFVTLIIQAKPGDFRNWEAIRAWAASLPALFETGGARK